MYVRERPRGNPASPDIHLWPQTRLLHFLSFGRLRPTLKLAVLAMKMARVILFTPQIDAMSRFYGEVFGLEQVAEEKGWREYAAGSVTIALHSGPSSPGRKGPKLVFHADDVAKTRESLVQRGAKFGKVRDTGKFRLCDGKDPDGNPVQLSSR
jgi:catechol 2,3-dioxygenase-like lactoylglutathione lyase family enzyme